MWETASIVAAQPDVRAALVDFPREQLDASVSFGMGGALRFRRIILPQILRTCLPALVNEMSLLIKASPAVAVVGIVDVTRAAVRVGAQTYRPLPPLAGRADCVQDPAQHD